MIARGALWNPSIFLKDEPKPLEEVTRNYVEAALRGNATYQNTKWVLNEMLTAGAMVPMPSQFYGLKLKDFKHKLGQTKNMTSICTMFELPYDASSYPERAHTTQFYRENAVVKAAEAEMKSKEASNSAKRPRDGDA